MTVQNRIFFTYLSLVSGFALCHLRLQIDPPNKWIARLSFLSFVSNFVRIKTVRQKQNDSAVPPTTPKNCRKKIDRETFSIHDHYILSLINHISTCPRGYVGGINYISTCPRGYVGGINYISTCPRGYVGGINYISTCPRGYVGGINYISTFPRGYVGGFVTRILLVRASLSQPS